MEDEQATQCMVISSSDPLATWYFSQQCHWTETLEIFSKEE
jgi:hypothetical protein